MERYTHPGRRIEVGNFYSVSMRVHRQAEVGFDRAAEAYERGRPGYPADAIAWLTDQLRLGPGKTVLDVAAGTGKLTRKLLQSGAGVTAVEPVAGMRAILERELPGAELLAATAEELPLPAASVDAIAVGQAFHWFDGPAALAEFHRVLRPGGRLGLIWNRRRSEEPLQQAISAIAEPHRGSTPQHSSGAWRRALEDTKLFASVDRLLLASEQHVDAEGLVDRVVSVSFIAALAPPEREQVAAQVRELAARSPQPLVLGYETEVYVFEASDSAGGR